MEELLRPVSRVHRKDDKDTELLTIAKPSKASDVRRTMTKVRSPEEVLEALKSQPDYDTLIVVLHYLHQGAGGDHAFNILQPSPQGAQVVHLLVTEIVPNYWAVLKDGSPGHQKNRDLDLLLSCLLSVAGINALLVFLKALLQQARSDPKGPKLAQSLLNLRSVINILEFLLEHDDQIRTLWQGVRSHEDNPGRARALRQECVSLIAGGRIVSLSAEAEALLRSADELEHPSWLADSKEYVKWLGNSLTAWIKTEHQESSIKLCAELVTRSLKLGHAGQYSISSSAFLKLI